MAGILNRSQNFNGTGGESIYGEKFADEDFTLTHQVAPAAAAAVAAEAAAD